MSGDDEDNSSARCLLAVLAEINKAAIHIAVVLSGSPEVQKATSGCDVLEHPDFMQPDRKVQTFEAYAEAQMHDGEMFVWAMELRGTVAGWQIHRTISKGEVGGAQVITSFRDLAFENLHELAANAASITAEFIDSAKTFDFSDQVADLRRQP